MSSFVDNDLAIIKLHSSIAKNIINNNNLFNSNIIIYDLPKIDIDTILDKSFELYSNVYFELDGFKNPIKSITTTNIFYTFNISSENQFNYIYKLNLISSEYIYYKFIISLNLDINSVFQFINFLQDYSNINFIIDFADYNLEFIDMYIKLYTFIDDTKNIYIDRSNYLTLTLIEHPCNMCLCNGSKCHGNKSKYPKDILIDKNYGLHLYGSTVKLTTIDKNQLFTALNSTSKYVKKVMSNVYSNYLFNYKLKYFPLNFYYCLEETKNELCYS